MLEVLSDGVDQHKMMESLFDLSAYTSDDNGGNDDESDGSSTASKAPVLRENNYNVNFSIDVLYFVPENLKKVQESC